MLHVRQKNKLQDISKLLANTYTPSTLTAYKNDQATFIELTGKDLLQATPIDVAEYIQRLKTKGYAR